MRYYYEEYVERKKRGLNIFMIRSRHSIHNFIEHEPFTFAGIRSINSVHALRSKFLFISFTVLRAKLLFLENLLPSIFNDYIYHDNNSFDPYLSFTFSITFIISQNFFTQNINISFRTCK